MTVVTPHVTHVTEVWACYCCVIVTILRRKTSLSRLLGPGPGCFRFEAALAPVVPVRPERPVLEDGPVTEAGLSQLRAQFPVSCWPLRSRSQCHSDSGSGRYMILRLRDCTQCTGLTSVTIHGPSVQLTFIISQTDIDSETDILHSSPDSDPCQCQTYYWVSFWENLLRPGPNLSNKRLQRPSEQWNISCFVVPRLLPLRGWAELMVIFISGKVSLTATMELI